MPEPRDFFDATDELSTIRAWARARYAAPWAVFGAVLLRVAASTGPEVQLPGVIGGRASLNMIGAFVSASGGGKGISDKVARLAWPTEIIERPIGSGEGIAALFAPPKKPDAERVTRAIINVSEIDSLAGIASRQGSILLAQLKAAVMGELIGQANASEATSRVVQPHTYRCCLSIGAQPGHTSVIFNDTTGGTPQRILWFPTTDPGMPAERTDDPAPLNTDLPAWARTATDVVEIQYGPSSITEAIITAHLARQRGESDALDGHAMLTRLKVAAILAIMHHRSDVSEQDWQLSAEVMAVSDATRGWIVEQARQAARAQVRDRAVARAAGDAIYDDRVLEGVKRSIVRMLDRDGEQAGGDLRRRLGKREKRDLFDQAISLLENDGMVLSLPGQHQSVRYRIGSPVTNEVTPQKASSEGVTNLVTRDHSDNVTDLDTRRSHENERPKVSCAKWFNDHIAELRAADHTTAESFAVNAAGEEAGYTRNNLAQAAANHPDIVVIDRTGNTVTWSLTGDQRAVYRTASEFVTDYLDALPDDAEAVDQADFRGASDAAGYTWDAARKAAVKHPRIESVPAHGNAKAERRWLIAAINAEVIA